MHIFVAVMNNTTDNNRRADRRTVDADFVMLINNCF